MKLFKEGLDEKIGEEKEHSQAGDFYSYTSLFGLD
jgi:hypothetical protein